MSEGQTKSAAPSERQRSDESKKSGWQRPPKAGAPTLAPVGLGALLRHASEHPEDPGLRPLVARQLLALQASHGNAYVQRLVNRTVTTSRVSVPTVATQQVMRAAGPLTATQEAAARTFTRLRYDERSVRIIQVVVGTNVDGKFGDVSAQAVATWQGAQGLAQDGRVGDNTLAQMVANRVAAARHEHAIQIVADYHGLDVTSDTLAVRFDPALGADGATAFESGNVRIIRLGPTAFTSAARLRATIDAQLAAAAPAVAAPGARPALLAPARERAAITFNKGKFTDPRSVRAIQGLVGGRPDGIWGRDTVERVAQAQSNAGLAVDGKVGQATLQQFVAQLIAAGQNNAPLRMIVDYYNFRHRGNLLAIYFDATVAANASTDFRPNEPVRVLVGPAGMGQPFAGLVHTIAHEYEHVRRLKEGIPTAATHEFLGEAIEILSAGMLEEPLPGFANDAARAVANWNAMPVADRRRFRARFIAVRQRVRNRIAAGTAAQQALHAALLASYNAVVLPAP